MPLPLVALGGLAVAMGVAIASRNNDKRERARERAYEDAYEKRKQIELEEKNKRKKKEKKLQEKYDIDPNCLESIPATIFLNVVGKGKQVNFEVIKAKEELAEIRKNKCLNEEGVNNISNGLLSNFIEHNEQEKLVVKQIKNKELQECSDKVNKVKETSKEEKERLSFNQLKIDEDSINNIFKEIMSVMNKKVVVKQIKNKELQECSDKVNKVKEAPKEEKERISLKLSNIYGRLEGNEEGLRAKGIKVSSEALKAKQAIAEIRKSMGFKE